MKVVPDPDKLRRLYWEEKLSLKEIKRRLGRRLLVDELAVIFDCSPSEVLQKMYSARAKLVQKPVEQPKIVTPESRTDEQIIFAHSKGLLGQLEKATVGKQLVEEDGRILIRK